MLNSAENNEELQQVLERMGRACNTHGRGEEMLEPPPYFFDLVPFDIFMFQNVRLLQTLLF
jgi:hypothetical protein